MSGGGGAGKTFGGGGAGACIVAIGHTLPGGVCNVTVGAGGFSTNATWKTNATTGPGRDSSISVNGTTLYLAKGGGRGGSSNQAGSSGGCGGGAGSSAGYLFNGIRSGEKTVSTNIVNGEPNIGPTIETTYAVFGNKGGDQLDNTYNNNMLSCPGGGGIGAAGGNHAIGVLTAGSGGAGLNGARINNITYNFKSYFANNTTFGHNDNGYIGGGGAGNSTSKATQSAPGGIGGGGKGAVMYNYSLPATPGAENTGSGGGGGERYYGKANGNGQGGSGIVIIRYRT
jgi:hypothetical protein